MKRLLVCIALTACASGERKAVPVTPAPLPSDMLPPRALVECEIEGRFEIPAGAKLLLGEAGDVEGHFTGHQVLVQMQSLDTRSGLATAIVKAPAHSPALMLRAKLDASYLPIRTAHDVSVAGAHVVIPHGTALRVTSGDGARIGVTPRYGDFAVATPARCDDLVFDARRGMEEPHVPRSTLMHLVAKRAPLLGGPDGPTIFSLEARRDQPTVAVIESRGASRHIRYDDGVRIDGWMRAVDLAPGFGPDCDDCHGSVMDVDDTCPPPKGCADEKGGPFHASHKVAVRDRPSPEGQPLGWLEEDGEVRIVGHQGTYARVEPVKSEIEAPAGGFWIDEGILRPKGK